MSDFTPAEIDRWIAPRGRRVQAVSTMTPEQEAAWVRQHAPRDAS